MISHYMQFARNLSLPQTFRTYRDRRHDRFKSDFRQSSAMITVKAWCRKRYANFRRANNMMQLSLVICGQKLTFPCFRRVLILHICYVQIIAIISQRTVIFFPRYDHACFCTITCSLTNSNLVNLSCWTDIVTSDTPTFNL